MCLQILIGRVESSVNHITEIRISNLFSDIFLFFVFTCSNSFSSALVKLATETPTKLTHDDVKPLLSC